VAERLAGIESAGRIVNAPRPLDGQLLACVCLKTRYGCETGIAAAPDSHRVRTSIRYSGMASDLAAQTLDITQAPNERAALETCLREEVQIVTGGPCIGRHTIAKVIQNGVPGGISKGLLMATGGRSARRQHPRPLGIHDSSAGGSAETETIRSLVTSLSWTRSARWWIPRRCSACGKLFFLCAAAPGRECRPTLACRPR
jgi:hypothetical protein